MGIFEITLILAAFMCSLVAGLLFAFAIVVMPGIRSLNDRDFIRAFQVMDRIIQNNQPIFMLVWVGSVITLVISVLLGVGQVDGLGRFILIFATLAYILCVQLPTLAINIPLNNELQSIDVSAIDETGQSAVRKEFEERWTLWNYVRTVFACLTSLFLMILIYKL